MSSNYIKPSPDKAISKRIPSKRLKLIDYLNIRKKTSSYCGIDNDFRINIARNHEPFLNNLNQMGKLQVHDGCVNTIEWNKKGNLLLSGSDDKNLVITKPLDMFNISNDYNVVHKIKTRHFGNIFSARFFPFSNDSRIVSASSEGPILVTDVNQEEALFSFDCHWSCIYEVAPLYDDGNVFLSCGSDKKIMLYDLRCHRSCLSRSCPHPPLIKQTQAITTLSINPTNSNLLLVGRADGIGFVYDRRKLPNPANFSREKAHLEYLESQQQVSENNNGNVSSSSGQSNNKTSTSSYKWLHPLDGVISQFKVPNMKDKCRFTSLIYSPNGQQVLASYSQDYIYLFNHDKSSNIELVQTLSKNDEELSSSQSNLNNNQDEDDEYNLNSDDSYFDSQSTTGLGGEGGANNDRKRLKNNNNNKTTTTTARSRRRRPQIRVGRGWTETGIHSRPRSYNNSDNNSNQRESNILQTMTDVAFSLNFSTSNNDRRRLFPIEFLASLTSNDDNDSQQANNNSNRDDENEAENIVIDNDDDDDDDDDDEHEHGNEDSDVDDDNDGEEVDDFDNKQDKEKSSSSYKYVTTSDNNNNNNNNSPSGSNKNSDNNKNKVKISEETKLKFQNAFSDLKSKFNNITTYSPTHKYQGHRNCRTSIKEATFFGDNYICSGSDDARIYFWEKDTAKLVMAFQGDERVVNCLAPNPNHYVLASSGIDYDIKLWSTQNLLDCPLKISSEEMDEIKKNNEIMIEEARQTITVPPHLFFRVLAALGSNR